MKFRQRRFLWNLLKGLVLAAIAGSLLLNFALFGQAKKYYLELNQTRLDPVGLSYFPAQDVARTDSLRVVFFGDSRAASWIFPSLPPASGSGDYAFINRGIPSQTSVQTVQRFSAHVRPLKPDVVVVQVGINDLKTIALFPERRESIRADCRANIKQIVEESRKLGAVVLLTTIFPVGEVPLARKPFWSDAIAVSVKELNAYIATLAENKTDDDKIFLLDAFSLLADTRGMMSQEYSLDELHLNEQGYRVLNQALMPLIDGINQGTPVKY
jgi:lysophospholipase L1-like esterase